MMKLNIQLFASGTIEFPQAGSSYKTIRGKIEWSESNPLIENNTSKIHTKIYAKVGTGGTTGKQWSGNVNVNGTNHTFSSLDSSTTIKSTYVLLKEYDDTITHESDGSKKITISGSVTGPSGTSIAGVTSSGSQEVTLATIPRASEITATNADIGSSSIIVINKKNDSFTTTLKYKFASQTTYTTIVDKTSEKTYGWQIPTSFYALIPNAKYGSCSIEATTYNGSEQVGDTKYTSINIFANETLCKPIITNTSMIDTNETAVALTGDNTKFIKYISTPKLTWSASTKNSATLKSQTINNVSATSPYQSAWGETFRLDVVDSRSYSNTYNFVFPSVVNYFFPQITSSGKRKTSTSSNIILNVSGKFFNGNFSSSNQNTATFECKYKRKTDSDWTSVTIEPTINSDGTFTLSSYDLGEICDYQTSCQFSIAITDKVTSQSSNFSITVGEPNHYWYKKDDINHFRVNGNIRTDNLDVSNSINVTKNLTVNKLLRGGIANRNTTDTWMPVIREGYFDYTLRKFATNVVHTNHPTDQDCLATLSFLSYWNGAYGSGGASNLSRCASGEIASKEYVKEQPVLWSGAIYVNASHTVNLSQAISTQRTGIVLVWQRYSSGVANAWDINYTFIPKYSATNLSGAGVVCHLSDSAAGVFATKYIYVYDTYLKGNAVNENGATKRNSGITTTNNGWVLTKVLGV